MFAFVAVYFVSSSDPFVGAYIALEHFAGTLRNLSYDDVKLVKEVCMSPMPVIKKWMAASTALNSSNYED